MGGPDLSTIGRKIINNEASVERLERKSNSIWGGKEVSYQIKFNGETHSLSKDQFKECLKLNDVSKQEIKERISALKKQEGGITKTAALGPNKLQVQKDRPEIVTFKETQFGAKTDGSMQLVLGSNHVFGEWSRPGQDLTQFIKSSLDQSKKLGLKITSLETYGITKEEKDGSNFIEKTYFKVNFETKSKNTPVEMSFDLGPTKRLDPLDLQDLQDVIERSLKDYLSKNYKHTDYF